MNDSIYKLRASVFATFTAFFCLVPLAPARSADELEKQLIRVAAVVLDHARENGYQNIGVLKFAIENKNVDSVGRFSGGRDAALGRRLADKLEMALILKNSVYKPIGIAKNASDTAATIPGASHLSTDGANRLFTREYPMSWGETEESIDAFYSGAAVLTSDLSKMVVGIRVIDASSRELSWVDGGKFVVKPDFDELIDAGQSFTTRGIFDQSKLKLTKTQRKEKATQAATLTSLQVTEKATVKDGSSTLDTAGNKTSSTTAKHPLAPGNDDSPIEFEVRYDGQPQTIRIEGGLAFVKEPSEGQKVVFVVKRHGDSQDRLAVIVKVNGENTLKKQTGPDANCSAWIFEPQMKLFGINGYQINENELEPFRVLSDSESIQKEIDYAEHSGTIAISVYPERTETPAPEPTPTKDNDFDADFALLEDAEHPTKKPSTLAALQLTLDKVASRGLIGSSKKIDAKVTKTQMKRDSIPLMNATLRYYSPSDLPD